MSPESAASFSRHAPRLRQAAESLSQRLPSLLVEAERVAATVAPGVHGRRRTGMGETFWQFRQYQAGDAAELDRLAPVGALASPVRARAGMGGRRKRLAVVRPVRIHGVPLRRQAAGEVGARRSADAGAGGTPGARRRAGGPARRRRAAGDRALRHGDAHPLPRRCRRRARRRGAAAAAAAPCAPRAAVRLSAAARAAEPAPGPVRRPWARAPA